MAKRVLTDEAVRVIQTSTEPAQTLAERYGVSVSTIRATKYRQRNQHRDNPRKLGRPRKPRPECQCGCEQPVRVPGRRYLQGHNSKRATAVYREDDGRSFLTNT